jgi:hypothetical protein
MSFAMSAVAMKIALSGVTALVLSACASTAGPRPGATGPTPPVIAGDWSFDFDAGPGVATATLIDAAGQTRAVVRCQAPRGPIVLTDFSLPPLAADRSVSLTIGAYQSTTLGAGVTDNGRAAVRFSLPPADPVFQAITPHAPVRLATDNRGHVWQPGAALQINAVLNACIAPGS